MRMYQEEMAMQAGVTATAAHDPGGLKDLFKDVRPEQNDLGALIKKFGSK